jgi:hypothetical protein
LRDLSPVAIEEVGEGSDGEAGRQRMMRQGGIDGRRTMTRRGGIDG